MSRWLLEGEKGKETNSSLEPSEEPALPTSWFFTLPNPFQTFWTPEFEDNKSTLVCYQAHDNLLQL